MLGRGGLFRQQNVEKRRIMSVREWAELCDKEDLRAPGVDDVGLHHASRNLAAKSKPRKGKKKPNATEAESAEADATMQSKEGLNDKNERKANSQDNEGASTALASPPHSEPTPAADATTPDGDAANHHSPSAIESDVIQNRDCFKEEEEEKSEDEEQAEKNLQPKPKSRRQTQTRMSKEAHLAERAAKDVAFLETFDPHSDWLPANTTPFDYTPEFCQKLERQYWRNCGLGKPAWYGADMAGV